MLSALVRFSLAQRLVILLTTLAIGILGWISFHQLPVEAYPDVSPVKVQVISQWPGRGAEEVERWITVPVETGLNGLPKMTAIRSISLFGLSVVTLIFEDGTDTYFARQQILSRLPSISLPIGTSQDLSPDSGSTGEIYRYTLEGAQIGVMELRSLENWVLEREFKKIPGVVDVSSFGGPVKQFQVQVNPFRLRYYNLTLQQLFNAVSNSNNNVGANVLNRGEQAYVVRGLGLLRSVQDIENIVIASHNGTPVLVKDVATVTVGEQPRLGLVGKNHQDDVVEGIILLRRGEKAEETLAKVREKVSEINRSVLPTGARIVPFYDRTDLINTTTHTVLKNLTEGMILVLVVLVAFLGNIRSAIIVAITIPLSLLCAFILMNRLGIPANLLSLGAIDFGIIVNGAVILVENVFRHLIQKSQREGSETTILLSTQEVQGPIFISTAIIIAAYIPLFAMEGVEARIFTPMAYTMGFALVASMILALTLVPVLSHLFLPQGTLRERTPIMEPIRRIFLSLLRLALAKRSMVFLFALVLFVVSLILIPRLGTEFMPTLEEGNIWLRSSLPMTIDLPYATRLVHQTRELLLAMPEIQTVVSQLGRPDDGTDATGFFNAEYGIYLKPSSLWRPGMTKEKLVQEMENRLAAIPGVGYNFSQYIQDNVEEAISGVKGENSVKLFGSDLKILETQAQEVVSVLREVPGIKEVGLFRELGQPELSIEIDRQRCARYGINVADVENTIQMAIGGQAATQVLEEERRYDLVVRLLPEYRQEIDSISSIMVEAPEGPRIPLSALATLSLQEGPSFIYREGHARFIPIKFSVRGRDLGGAIAEAQQKVASHVKLPFSYRMDWSGEFGEMKRAQARLAITIPLSLVVILLLLYTAFNSVKNTFIVFITVPLALVGGIFTLVLTGINFSVSAAIGFISLFGIAVQNGVILIAYFEQLRKDGLSLEESIIRGVELRLRPVLMTSLLAALGLLPAAISTGIGAQAQKPLAMVIVGGCFFTTFLTLVVLPLLYQVVEERVLLSRAFRAITKPRHLENS